MLNPSRSRSLLLLAPLAPVLLLLGLAAPGLPDDEGGPGAQAQPERPADPVELLRGADQELEDGIFCRFDGLQSRELIDPETQAPVVVLAVELTVFGEAGLAQRLHELRTVDPRGAEQLVFHLDGVVPQVALGPSAAGQPPRDYEVVLGPQAPGTWATSPVDCFARRVP